MSRKPTMTPAQIADLCVDMFCNLVNFSAYQAGCELERAFLRVNGCTPADWQDVIKRCEIIRSATLQTKLALMKEAGDTALAITKETIQKARNGTRR